MEVDLDRLARRQHSLLTCWQLKAAGWSQTGIIRAVEAGELYPVRRSVFRTAGSLPSADMARMAAVLATNRRAVLGSLSTLSAFGFTRFPVDDRLHLISSDGNRIRQPGVVAHRTIWLPDHDLTRVRHIPTVTSERAFIDCCGMVSETALGEAGDDAVRRELMSIARLVRSFEQCPSAGRRTRTPMPGFLAERVKGYDPGGSQPEVNVRRVIVAAGYPPPVPQFLVLAEGHRHYIDHAYPETKHGLEYLGLAEHSGSSAVLHDAERTLRLQRAGWKIWPITKTTTANEIIAIAALATALPVN
jgi:hypothetical protein